MRPVATLRDERAADLIAVHAGQVAVEHQHVVVGERQVRERVVSVEGDVHGHALPAQAGGDRFRQLDVILDQQYPHGQPAWRICGYSAVTAASPCCNRPFRTNASCTPASSSRGDET